MTSFLGGGHGYHSFTDFFSRICFVQPHVQVFAVNVLGLPKPVKNQIEMSLLITGTAAVTFFNELYVFAGVISMFFCCSGLMEWRHRQEKKQYVYDSFYAGLSAALGVLIFFIR